MSNLISKCIVWGIGNSYDKILNQILFEIHKGNISIEALVCCKEDKYSSSRDGFPIITKEEINNVDFDYVVIASNSFFKEIRNEALQLNIEESKIIDGRKFQLPLFDFKRYSQLIQNTITILSDDCWGGYAYNRLGLPFSSPLINIYWERNEYAKLIVDPLYYLNSELTVIEYGDLRKGITPIGQLGDKNRNVKLNFTHNVDFNEAKIQWDRRKKRINPNNLFVKMGFLSSDQNKQSYLDAFEHVPYNKILFYNGDEDIKGAFKTERFIWRQTKLKRVEHSNYNDFVRLSYYRELDLLKLLTSETNYSREGY